MGECLVHPLMYTYHIYSPKIRKIVSSSHDFEVTNCDSKSYFCLFLEIGYTCGMLHGMMLGLYQQ